MLDEQRRLCDVKRAPPPGGAQLPAAVELRSSLGPARAFSMVAERAGVQRHTLHAHVPDERSLLLACSGLTAECDPLPTQTLDG